MTEIRVFEHRTLLRHPREVVFRWLENPGALERLTPPFAGEVVQGPTDGLRVGSESRLRIQAPRGGRPVRRRGPRDAHRPAAG
ncbi:hypothetical protein GQ85_44270, partial [Rhodococcus rhodochrous]